MCFLYLRFLPPDDQFQEPLQEGHSCVPAFIIIGVFIGAIFAVCAIQYAWDKYKAWRSRREIHLYKWKSFTGRVQEELYNAYFSAHNGGRMSFDEFQGRIHD